jgi:acyl carrier protein
MTPDSISPATVRQLLLSECSDALAALGMTPAQVPDDFDLRAHGVVDSLGFLELVTALEEELGLEVDLDVLAPEHLTTVGPLVEAVAVQAATARGSARAASSNGFVGSAP